MSLNPSPPHLPYLMLWDSNTAHSRAKNEVQAKVGLSPFFSPQTLAALLESSQLSASSLPPICCQSGCSPGAGEIHGPPTPAGRGATPNQKLRGPAVPPGRDDMLDVETDAYIHCVSAFVKLAQSEYQLLTDVIPEHHQKKTFDSLIQVWPHPTSTRCPK